MSVEDAERFANDLVTNKDLLAKVKQEATGLGSIVAIGKEHGYDFTLEEAKTYIQSRSSQELTNEQLNAVAGGKSKAVQTSSVATTVEEAAEVATTAVQVSQAAADVAAVSEAVAVVVAV